MNNLTFRECRKYIEALKKKPVFLGIKGHEAGKYLDIEDLGNKVVIATSKKHRLIVVSTEEGFSGFHFQNNVFKRHEILASLDAYRQESYNFSLFQIDTEKLLAFLQADEQTLVTVHQEIDFEMGLRLRKKFLGSPVVLFIIYYWASGPMLLCNRRGDQDFFSLSDARRSFKPITIVSQGKSSI